VRAKKLRPVLRYFGGKFRLADWIISHMPEHRVYVEPYGGAASVLMKKPRSYGEVWNDLDDSVYHLFWCLKHERLALELKLNLERTPFSRREFETAHCYHPDPLENSRRLVIRSFMGFGADSVNNRESKTGFRSNSNRSGTTPAHDWVNYSQHIDTFFERMKGVVIENKPALDVMLEHDAPLTLHYVDPPYPHTTRRGGRYLHEMNNSQHEELCDALKSLKGKVMLSSYDNDLYRSLGWRSETKEARADKAGQRVEVLYMNW
jgi:DNA adenine methylase